MTKQEKFYSAMQKGLIELGVSENPNLKSSYPQMLDTRLGDLLIHVEGNDKDKSSIYTCYTRFENVDKAKEQLDCNPYTGKWNFHAYTKVDPETYANYILGRIKRIT